MELTVTCPHCQAYVVIEAINCGVFRHGMFILSGTQMPPHASQSECEAHILNKTIYGCGKPFCVQRTAQGAYETRICGYV
jgi:hypothetical protein